MINSILAATTKRVAQSTSPNVNACIRNKTIQSLNLYKDCSKELISERIKKLDYEWDSERVQEAKAGFCVLMCSLLGLRTRKCWFLATATIGLFLLQNALMGWCPSGPFLRKAGIRTSEEINNERIVLKMLRGDFDQSNDNKDIPDMLLRAEK